MDNQNNQNTQQPGSILPLTDDEAIKEIDLGRFLDDAGSDAPIFEGFHEDIERKRNSIEDELNSLYDSILRSGRSTIVPRSFSELTADEASAGRPAAAPAAPEAPLDTLWMNPEDYMDLPAPEAPTATPEESVFSPEAVNAPSSETLDAAKDDIFSLIDDLKSGLTADLGFGSLRKEIESSPDIAPVPEDLSAAAAQIEPPEAPPAGDPADLPISKRPLHTQSLVDAVPPEDLPLNTPINEPAGPVIPQNFAPIDELAGPVIPQTPETPADASAPVELDFDLDTILLPEEAPEAAAAEAPADVPVAPLAKKRSLDDIDTDDIDLSEIDLDELVAGLDTEPTQTQPAAPAEDDFFPDVVELPQDEAPVAPEQPAPAADAFDDSLPADLAELLGEDDEAALPTDEEAADAFSDSELDALLAEALPEETPAPAPAVTPEAPEEKLPEDLLFEDAPEDLPVEEAPAEPLAETLFEAPVDAEDIIAAEELAEALPVEEPAVEEPPVEEAPVEETPVEEIPAEEFPVEEIPFEEIPVETLPEEAPAPLAAQPAERTPILAPIDFDIDLDAAPQPDADLPAAEENDFAAGLTELLGEPGELPPVPAAPAAPAAEKANDFADELSALLGEPGEPPVAPAAPEKAPAAAENDFAAELTELLGDDAGLPVEPAAPHAPIEAAAPDYQQRVIDAIRAEDRPLVITAHDDDETFEDPEANKTRKQKKAEKKAAKKKGGVGEVIRKIVLTLSILTIIGSLGFLANTYLIEPLRFKNDAAAVAEQLSQDHSMHGDSTEVDANIKAENPDVVFPEGMLAKYARLYAANSDLRGWISIPKLEINLPVTQGKDNDYSLHRNVYAKRTEYGVPFFDYRMTDFKSLHRNTVVYGHNKRYDDLIFGMLENYREISGFMDAPVIECNTIYGDYTWFVYAVFITNSAPGQDNGYLFPYNFIDISDAKFTEYIKEIDNRKFYTTGVDLNKDDKILTLSTCCYDFDGARLVVVARMRREGESVTVDTSRASLNQNPKYPQAWYDANKKSNPYEADARW